MLIGRVSQRIALIFLMLTARSTLADEKITCATGQTPGADHGKEGAIKIIVLKCTRDGDKTIVKDSGVLRCPAGQKWVNWYDESNEQIMRAKCVPG